jgi:putative transposase
LCLFCVFLLKYKMDELYNNKYRIISARRPNWDYGSHGLYFVTICTKDRVQYFGKIIGDKDETQSIVSLHQSGMGSIAYNNWNKIPQYHPYVELDEFIVMPDHIHGILFINKPDKLAWDINKFGPQRNNLASIIRGYKSSVKQYATINNLDFLWQPKYYDRVIRNEQEYLNIKEYIYNNVDNWFSNKNNFENLYLL